LNYQSKVKENKLLSAHFFNLEHYLSKKSLLTFLLSLLFLMGSFAASYTYQNYKKQTLESSLRQYQLEKSRYQQGKYQQKLVELYQADYHNLKKQGIIAKESRLNWLEAFNLFKEKQKISFLDIHLKAQVLVSSTTTVQVYKSSLSFLMHFTDEKTLFSLFPFLKQNAKGLYHIEFCHIQQHNEVDQEFLSLRCELSWYTIADEINKES
jgi:hypothetical protein